MVVFLSIDVLVSWPVLLLELDLPASVTALPVIVSVQLSVQVPHLLWPSPKIPTEAYDKVHCCCMQAAPCLQPPPACACMRIHDLHDN